MNDQPGETPTAEPLFSVGDRVLIDEGPRGVHVVETIEPGMIPAVGETLETFETATKPGYWYTASPEGGGMPYRAPEFNLEPAPEATSGDLAASEAPTEVDGPPAVLNRLREAYKAGEAERRTTIPIAPGRYHDLAAQYRPIDWELRRRLMRKAERTGAFTDEANANFQATLCADACISIMVRPEPGAEFVELHTLVDRYKADAPIRFDERLAAILGIDLIGGESQADICRLVFGGEAAFEVHFTQLSQWSAQVAPGEEDEEEGEDEGGGRPT